MAQIDILNVTFGYDGSEKNIFDKATFRLDADWKLGLVGRNGKGKTTFLKLLMGAYEYTGTIQTSVLFDYFPFVVQDKERLGIEVIDEIDADNTFWKVCKELNLLEIEIDALYRPFSTLSQGEQTKVMLGVLFAKENHFLLIDEPTNHLDKEARGIVMEYLRKKKGFILVSHDRQFLDGCIDHVLAMNREDIEVLQGNFTTWWEQKNRRDKHEFVQNEKLQKEVGRLSKAAKQTETWSHKVEKSKHETNSGSKVDKGYIGHKSAKMMKRSLNARDRVETAIREKKQLLRNVEHAEKLKLYPLAYQKDVLVTFEDVALSYDTKKICENITFSIRQGDCVALVGRNGCGKSSILKYILGENIACDGRAEMGTGLKISYVPQDSSVLCGDLRTWLKEQEVEEHLVMSLLRKLDFERELFEKPMQIYSEGQRKKVLLAKSLCESAHLYIWDEPLNYVDVFSRMQIEELIREFCPTILLVEHDERFLEEIKARKISMKSQYKTNE